jgi:thiol-disulfide isomerase/thioredoxin
MKQHITGRMLVVAFLLATNMLCAQVRMVKGDWISTMTNNQSDTVYVINFWATWCKPCVEELPSFEKLTSEYAGKKLKVILVSCDFKKQIDSRLIPFINTKNIVSEVVFMDESNSDNWINKVDRKFSGAIPATLIIQGSRKFRHFSEGETTYEELEKIVKPLID